MLATTPIDAANSTMRRDELNSNAKPPTPTKLATAASRYQRAVGVGASIDNGDSPVIADTNATDMVAAVITAMA